MQDDLYPLPVKNGDWVARCHDPGIVAKVRAVYADERGEILVDLVLYAPSGVKIGRESPALDGPRHFEPAVPYTGQWSRISTPQFPILLRWQPQADGTAIAGLHHGARALPDRAWVPKPRSGAAAAGGVKNFDPEMEAAARRLAAQELRDIARQTGISLLIERAIALETEASALSQGGRS